MKQETIDDKCKYVKELKQTKRLYLCSYSEKCEFQINVFTETYCKKYYEDGGNK